MKKLACILLAVLMALACAATAEGTHISITTGRPIDHPDQEVIVKLDNEPGARPQKGIGSADIVYEIELYNGGYTRYTAVFNDTIPELVEAVRSARNVNADVYTEYYGVFVHFGGQKMAGTNVYEHFGEMSGVTRFDGISEDGGSTFYRDKSRKAPNNVICLLPKIMERADWSTITAHCPLTFNAAFAVPEQGEDCATFKIVYRETYTPSYEWDAAAGRYLRYYNGKPYVDGSTDEQVMVDNVIVQTVDYAWFGGSSDRPFVNVLGTNSCEYFIGGKHISGYWVRDGLDSNTRYYDNAGNLIQFNPGVTFIQFLKTGKSVEIG